MRVRKLLVLLAVFAVLAAGCKGTQPPAQVSFAAEDFSSITEVIILNGRSGALSSVSEPEKVADICEFIKGISGIGGIRAKGDYESTYTVYLYSSRGEEYKLMFADEDVLYYTHNGDPVRYMLNGLTARDITDYFTTFDASGYDWNK